MRAKWGQNFLSDSHWQRKILSYFSPPGDFVEIGPGKGALTQHLAQQYQGFRVVEIDPKLQELHVNQPNYELIRQDFLQWDFESDPRYSQVSFIGNLPYESASAMMRKIVQVADQVAHFVFLVQREVAERWAAVPKTQSYSAQSVIVQSQFDFFLKEVVPPGAFRPAPKVDSQIVQAFRRKHPHRLGQNYFDFLQFSFQNRRKQVKRAWSQWSQGEVLEMMKDLGLSEKTRAEEIPLELWPQIYEGLKRE